MYFLLYIACLCKLGKFRKFNKLFLQISNWLLLNISEPSCSTSAFLLMMSLSCEFFHQFVSPRHKILLIYLCHRHLQFTFLSTFCLEQCHVKILIRKEFKVANREQSI